MLHRLIVGRRRWRLVRDFVLRHRCPARLSVEQRAADYVAIAEAFGAFWPRDARRVRLLIASFGDRDPDAVLAAMRPVAAPVRLRPVVRVWTRAVH
jgi:hypothetical protein